MLISFCRRLLQRWASDFSMQGDSLLIRSATLPQKFRQSIRTALATGQRFCRILRIGMMVISKQNFLTEFLLHGWFCWVSHKAQCKQPSKTMNDSSRGLLLFEEKPAPKRCFAQAPESYSVSSLRMLYGNTNVRIYYRNAHCPDFSNPEHRPVWILSERISTAASEASSAIPCRPAARRPHRRLPL